MLVRESEILTLMKGDDEDAGFWGFDYGLLHQSFGGGWKTCICKYGCDHSRVDQSIIY